MTNSDDTATPALSVESEYVLVPREPTEAMLNATPASYSSSFKTIWPLEPCFGERSNRPTPLSFPRLSKAESRSLSSASGQEGGE